MTGTRLRSRFFIGLGALLMIVAFVVIKFQLDEARETEVRCEQRLKDLEKKLKSERNQYEQLKSNLKTQSQKQEEIKERSIQEANAKLTSLQQHYKLLKNQFEDYKEECSKTKSGLQSSLNSFKKQHTCSDKDNEIALWKAKYFTLLNETKLTDFRPTTEGTKDVIAVLKKGAVENPSTQHTVTKNFSAQIAISDKLYAIPIKYNNNSNNADANTSIKSMPIPLPSSSTASSINQTASQNLNRMTEANNEDEHNLKKFPLGVVPFVPPNIIDSALQSSENVQLQDQKNAETLKRIQKEKNEDVGAREENDSNYFVAEEHNHNNHLPKEDHLNPAYENFNQPNKKGKENKLTGVDDLQVIQQANDGLDNNRNKLKNEVNEDQGKAYADDVNFQMEDEDDDEYADHRVHQQGQAVRERR